MCYSIGINCSVSFDGEMKGLINMTEKNTTKGKYYITTPIYYPSSNLHIGHTYCTVMRILKEEGAFSDERKSWFPKRPGPDGTGTADARVMLHCFSSSREIARQYVKLGATISICGPVTYKNNRRTTEVVQDTPIEFLLVETDAPYLTPEPLRGRPNKSTFVEYTARRVAALKGMPFEDVARITCENARRFFGIE